LLTCGDNSTIFINNSVSENNFALVSWDLSARVTPIFPATLDDVTLTLENENSGTFLDVDKLGGSFFINSGLVPNIQTVRATAQIGNFPTDFGCTWDVVVTDVTPPVMQCNEVATGTYTSDGPVLSNFGSLSPFLITGTVDGIASIDDVAAYNASNEAGDGVSLTLSGFPFFDETSPLVDTTTLVVVSGQSQYNENSTLDGNVVVAYIHEDLVLSYTSVDDQGNIGVSFDNDTTITCTLTIVIIDDEEPVLTCPGPVNATGETSVNDTVALSSNLFNVDAYDNHDVWVSFNTTSGGATLSVTSLLYNVITDYPAGYATTNAGYGPYPVSGSPSIASPLRLAEDYVLEGLVAKLLPGGTIQTNTLTLTAVDQAGNTGTCTFDIQVHDNASPTFNLCNQSPTINIPRPSHTLHLND